MTKTDLDGYRKKLLTLRDQLAIDLSSLADEAIKPGEGASGNLSHLPIHPADLGTDNYDQQMAIGLLENKEQSLTEISDALERIDQGTFGRCEACQKAIAKPRLQTLPYARYCVTCADRNTSPR